MGNNFDWIFIIPDNFVFVIKIFAFGPPLTTKLFLLFNPLSSKKFFLTNYLQKCLYQHTYFFYNCFIYKICIFPFITFVNPLKTNVLVLTKLI